MIGTVVIIKNKKKVVLHSKLQKFDSIGARDKFLAALLKAYKGKGYSINHYTVSEEPKGTEITPKRGKYYCPYCTEENKLKQGEFGSRVCPICGISEQDFYFKKYNKVK